MAEQSFFLTWKSWVGIGAVICGLSVAFGAFGAHALKGQLSEDQMRWYKTAFEYQAIHGLGLMCLGLFASRIDHAILQTAGFLLLLGILLFSGSLYAMSLGGPRSLAILTPFGGGAFCMGWLFFAVSCFRQ